MMIVMMIVILFSLEGECHRQSAKLANKAKDFQGLKLIHSWACIPQDIERTRRKLDILFRECNFLRNDVRLLTSTATTTSGRASHQNMNKKDVSVCCCCVVLPSSHICESEDVGGEGTEENVSESKTSNKGDG